MQQRTEKVGAPKSIVPFKVEKKVCKTKFKNFAKKNMYVPMNIRRLTVLMNSEEYTFRIIVTKRQLKVTMMHMERRRQLKRKRRRFIQLPDIGRFMHRFMAM